MYSTVLTLYWCCRGHDRMVVEFTTTYAISADHHWSCEFTPCSWRGVLDTTMCDKVCQWLATGRWFSPGTPVSSTNKTDILLTEELNTITLPLHLTFYGLGVLNPLLQYSSHPLIRPLPPQAIPLTRPLPPQAIPLIRPLPPKATFLYQARFQRHYKNKILLSSPPKERPPLL
jgi:hypothetical protein